jgi:hypothetical protein
LVLQRALLLIAYTFLLELPHALGAMLLSSDQRSLDAASICLLCYAFSLGPSSTLLLLRTKLPHVLNATLLTFFIELPELSPGTFRRSLRLGLVRS